MAGKRRGNGEGSITKFEGKDGKHDRWVARLALVDGRRKALYAKTRQEALRKLNTALRERDQGILTSGDERQTVAQYIQRWLDMVLPGIKAHSLLRSA